MRQLLIAFAISTLFVGDSFAREEKPPEVVVEVDRTRIDEGDSIQYRVTVNNVDQPTKPELGSMEGVQVEYLGETQNSFTSIVIINGRRIDNSQNGRRYTFRLTPQKTGTLKIPAPKSTLDGKDYFGKAVTITVRPTAQQDLVALELTADRTEVYPLQSFAVTLRIYIKALPAPYSDRDPVGFERVARSLAIPWVDDRTLPEGVKPMVPLEKWLGPLRRPDGKGFRINNIAAQTDMLFFENRALHFELAHRTVKRKDASGKDVDYWEYSLSRQFNPQKIGDVDFGPATLRGEFVQTVTEDGQARFDEVRALSKRLRIKVKDVPSAGRPEWFTGAVGTFSVDAYMTPREAKVGDPLTLLVTLKGSGMLDASPPDLSRVPGVIGNFRVYDGTAKTSDNERQFTYSVRPSNAKVREFPAIPISYFDVRSEKYVTVKTPPIALKVTVADKVATNDVANFGSKPGPETLVPNEPVGIRANVTSAADFKDDSIDAFRCFGFVGGLASTYALICGVVAFRRRITSKRIFEIEIQKSEARRLIDNARNLAMNNDPTANQTVRLAICHATAALAGLHAEALTSAEIADALRRQKLDAGLIERIVHWLDAEEANRYSQRSPAGEQSLASGIALADELANAM